MNTATTPHARILIVEDESLVAEDLQMRLERLGYEVVGIADNAKAAIAAAAELTPDLVLLDIRLKGPGDGVEVASRLRQQQIGFVFLTAHADRATLDRTGATEPLGYVVKPFEERGVHATIETALCRHQAELRQKRMEHWLATTLRSIGDAVVVTDQNRRISYVNPVAARLLLVDARSALGQPCDELLQIVGDDGRTLDDPVARALLEGAVIHLQDDVSLRRHDHSLLPVDDCASPIRDDAGVVHGVVLVFRDASDKRRLQQERRRVQKRLQEAERLRGLGVLASGLAHDFNNILTTILGNVALGQQEAVSSRERMRSLDAIESSALAAAELCRQMLDTASVGRLDAQPVDLDRLLADTEAAVRAALGDGVRLGVAPAGSLPPAAGDRGQLGQVLTNLVLNAAEAMAGKGGRIDVRSGRAEVSAAELAETVGSPELPGGEYLFFEVQDDGPGMDPVVKAQVFEPFFTTKFTGRGLGLASVLGIVRRHKGAIALDTAPGQGARFRVLLPAFAKSAAATPPAASAAASSGGDAAAASRAGAVLVADDDEGIRRVIGRWLGNEQYRWLEAADADAALQQSAEHGDLLAAVVDCTMPGRGTVDLLAGLRRRQPQLPVLLVSGLPPSDELAQLPHTAFLQKPFSLAELRSALAQLLRPHG